MVPGTRRSLRTPRMRPGASSARRWSASVPMMRTQTRPAVARTPGRSTAPAAWPGAGVRFAARPAARRLVLRTPSLELARAAQARSREFVRATPVVPLYGEDAEVLCSLKLECLQDTGSFKIRGATNAIRIATDMNPGMPVYTISAGNMGAALARAANLMGVRAVVVVPDTAPATKLAGIKRWGANR